MPRLHKQMNTGKHPGYRQQRGIAMLTALLVVALATIIAVNITERQQYDIRRLGNILYSQQAYYYALGGESWARGILYKDGKSSSHKNTDNLFEDWAQPLPVTIIEGGTISGQITDLSGLFNINNLFLLDPKDPLQVTRQKQQIEMFNRLLQVLEINVPLTQAIIDWIDQDADISFPDGAEDQTYQQKTPPYRSSNRLMSSPTELLLVEGFTAEIYAKLQPFVTALPESTTVNINTASAEVIAALSSQLDLKKATEIVEDRGTVFNNNKEFKDQTESYASDKGKYQLEIEPLIGVSSQYFKVKALVQIDTVSSNLHSVLKRNSNGSIETISRSPGVD